MNSNPDVVKNLLLPFISRKRKARDSTQDVDLPVDEGKGPLGSLRDNNVRMGKKRTRGK